MEPPATNPAALAPALTKPAAGSTPEDARRAAQDFEAVFLAEMLGNMYEGVSTDGPFGGGHGEAVMRSLLVDEYAKSIAARGGIGIADNVYRELIHIQETSNGPAAGR